MSGHGMSEWSITNALARGPFRDAVCLVPNVTIFGGEIDLLVVKKNKKLIDCEVKISAADLKADAKKDKWWQRRDSWRANEPTPPRLPLEWPRGTWKHYYAMPETLWREGFIEIIAKTSGVLLVRENNSVRCRRPAKPNNAAKEISDGLILSVARLATLRMWDARIRGGIVSEAAA